MGSDDKPKGADEATRAMALRATAMAQRLKDAAARGGPAIDQLSARVHGKLKDVPQERIQPPPANIEAPTALHYALLGDGPDMAELREFFENLLAASMDRDTTANAHPAFVSMIAQLSSDEAHLLRSIESARPIALLEVCIATQKGDTRPPEILEAENLSVDDVINHKHRDTYIHVKFATTLGHGIGINEDRLGQYLSNLQRLGILEISLRGYATELEQDYTALGLRVLQERVGNWRYIANRGTISLTPLGHQFWISCAVRR